MQKETCLLSLKPERTRAPAGPSAVKSYIYKYVTNFIQNCGLWKLGNTQGQFFHFMVYPQHLDTDVLIQRMRNKYMNTLRRMNYLTAKLRVGTKFKPTSFDFCSIILSTILYRKPSFNPCWLFLMWRSINNPARYQFKPTPQILRFKINCNLVEAEIIKIEFILHMLMFCLRPEKINKT